MRLREEASSEQNRCPTIATSDCAKTPMENGFPEKSNTRKQKPTPRVRKRKNKSETDSGFSFLCEKNTKLVHGLFRYTLEKEMHIPFDVWVCILECDSIDGAWIGSPLLLTCKDASRVVLERGLCFGAGLSWAINHPHCLSTFSIPEHFLTGVYRFFFDTGPSSWTMRPLHNATPSDELLIDKLWRDFDDVVSQQRRLNEMKHFMDRIRHTGRVPEVQVTNVVDLAIKDALFLVDAYKGHVPSTFKNAALAKCKLVWILETLSFDISISFERGVSWEKDIDEASTKLVHAQPEEISRKFSLDVLRQTLLLLRVTITTKRSKLRPDV